METQDTTLIVVIANLIIQPLLQYLLHSRCRRISCFGVECEREVLKSKEEEQDKTEQEQIEF
tara:strand:- start:448 stop:633 length:186 start_codon:yes stop_codon:yes gene_type:complete